MSSITDDGSTSDLPPHSPVPILALWILCLLIVILFSLSLVYSITVDTDYPHHIVSAISLATTGQFDRPRPQFLYHILLIALSPFMPGDGVVSRFASAALLLGQIYYLCSGLIVFDWLAKAAQHVRSWWKWPVLVTLTLTVMLVSSVNLLTWGTQNLYLGYLTANTYQNPTVLLAKPFGLLLFALSHSIFSTDQPSPKKLVFAGVVALFGTFAKPNYPMALLPALAVVGAYAFLKKQPIRWTMVGAVFIPVIVALASQFILYSTDQASSFEFAPLKVMSFYSPDGQLFAKFILSILFPAVVYVLHYPRSRKHIELQLAWLAFGFACAYTYLLAETVTWRDGNFTWGTQIALFILFALLIRFLIVEYTEAQGSHPHWKLLACGLLLGLHLIGGLALYWSQLQSNFFVWW